MKDPELFDSDGFLDQVGSEGEKEFRRLYQEKWAAIDKNRAKDSYENTFETTIKKRYKLYRDIVNSFSGDNGAEGSESGFETTIINPLLEFGDSGAEVLLARKHVTGVHLCFVSCNESSQDVDTWRSHINNTYSLMSDEDNRERLKEHIESPESQIRTVQYLTFTKAFELVDIDVDVLRFGTDPDEYAIWKLIESELPEDELEEVNKEIQYHDGSVAVPDLDQLGRDGLDPTIAENDDFRFCLTTHPVYVLREILLKIYLDNHGVDEPKEFRSGRIKSTFKNLAHVGENRDSAEEMVEERASELTEFALEHGIISDDEDTVEERDFRIMWGSEDAGDIKKMVKNKYISDQVPNEMGRLAFQRAEEDFEPPNESLGKY